MENYIKLGLNIALAVFLFFGIIAGLIRGLRKTASRGIFLILTAILTLFLTIPITNLLLDIQFPINLTIEESTLSGNHNIEQLLSFIVENYIGKDFATNNPEFLSVITAIPLMFINSIVYLLLFWTLKYLLLPLNYLFYRLTFAPKKKKENIGFSASNEEDPNTTPIEQQPQEEHKVKDNSKFEPSENPDSVNQSGLFVINIPEEEKLANNQKKKKEKKLKTAKEKKTKNKKIKENSQVKKHRLLGGFIGAFIGLFIMANTMVPIYGFINILQEGNKLNLQNISDTEISLANQTDGLTSEITNAYNSSILKTISHYTGLEGLSLAEFDYITTKKIGDNKITLREDIKTLIETAQKIDHLLGTYKDYVGEGNFSNLDKNQITVLLNSTKEVITYSRNVKIINTLSDYIIPATCSIILNSETNFTNNDNINLMIEDLITALNTSSHINLFDEITNLIGIAEYLNEKDVLVKILQNDFSQPLDIINSLDSDFTNKLFTLNTINTLSPHILNLSLTIVDESISFGFVKNEASSDTIKNALSEFINNTLEFTKTLDAQSKILISYNSLIPLGKAMQVAKSSGLLTTQTYDNLVDYAIIELKKLLQGILPEEFESYLQNELLNNISKVDNWEYEMSVINNAITKLRNKDNGILGDAVNGENLRQGTTINLIIKENTLNNIGEALDILEETCIFGARTYKNGHQISGTSSLMISILDYAKTTVTKEFADNENMLRFNEVLDEIQNNIINANHTYSKENPFWKNELSYISPLVVNIYNMMDNDNFTLNSELGKHLDKAKASTMLGNNTTLTLMNVALDIVKNEILPDNFAYNNGTNISNSQDINDKIYELFESIDNNLKTNTIKEMVRTNPKFWEEEIDIYTSLKEVAEKTTNISSIEDATSMGEELDKVYNSYTIPRQGINNIIAFAMRDTKYTNLTADDKVKLAINNTIESIANKLEDETFLDGKTIENFWTIEFNHIKSVTDIDFADSEIKSKLSQIGQTLDTISYGDNNVRNSYLISHQDLRNILGNAIDEMSTTLTSTFETDVKSIITTALNSIQDNIFDTTNITNISFKTELEHLQVLSELEVSKDLLTFPNGTNEEINAKLESNRVALQTLGTQLDGIAFNFTYKNPYYEYTDTNSKIITRAIINKLISDLFDLAKVDGTDTKETAFNNLIVDIQGEITKYSDLDAIISWERELSYVNRLVELNKGTTFTVSNVAEEIGKNVDKIAFNQTTTTFNDIEFSDNKCKLIPTTDGNSLFITRSALKEVMSSFLSTVKYEIDPGEDQLEIEKKEIINDIIDNITDICETNTQLASGQKYKTMEAAFNDLSNIDSTITTTIDGLTGDIVALKSAGKVSGIDNMLNTFENKPACQVLITRRIALLILKNIVVPSGLLETTTYYNKLKTHYETNITNNSTESEHYETNDELNTASTYNPFDTLLSTVNV